MARGNSIFELKVSALLDEKALSKKLADHAAKRIKTAADRNRQILGVDSPYTVKVDGRLGAPLHSVRPDGEIVAEFDLLGDTLTWIYNALVNSSPVLTGQFYSSFVVLADGIEIDPTKEKSFADEWVFINTQPYARKIERGLSKQAPDGVFQVVTELARQRLGNIAVVRFGFRSLVGHSALNDWAETTGLQRKGGRMSAAARDLWLRRQPAIIVRRR